MHEEIYAEICNKKYAEICRNMQKYAQNMQKYAWTQSVWILRKNMQKHAKNMQKYAKICKNMQAYAIVKFICKNMHSPLC